MSQHTPGPWHRNIRANGKYPVVFAGRNQHVATTTQQTDPVETEANIDLIAAAPDLLEALKMATQQLEIDAIFMSLSGASGNHQAEVALVARAAIAKATGEKQ